LWPHFACSEARGGLPEFGVLRGGSWAALIGEDRGDGERLLEEMRVDSFTEFAVAAEPRLRHALTALYGIEAGKDAAAEALAYGWEHWESVGGMENPVGFLYVVGRNRGRRVRKRRVVFPEPPVDHTPWVEPRLAATLAALPARQRQVVMLVHGYGWTLGEVAEVLEVSKGTVQRHLERAVAKLQARLGVER
jgi:DNA-directed RNA polymerase specialized sigma24 family protein